MSLTRRPEDLPPLELLGVAGVLYLPALERDQVLALLAGAHRPTRCRAADRMAASSGVRSRSPLAELGERPGASAAKRPIGRPGRQRARARRAHRERPSAAGSPLEARSTRWTPGLLLSHDLRVTYANARWADWRGAAIPLGAPLATLVDLGRRRIARRAARDADRRRAARRALHAPLGARGRRVAIHRLHGAARRHAGSCSRRAARPTTTACRCTTSRAGSPKSWTWRRCSARCATSRRGSATALARRCCA